VHRFPFGTAIASRNVDQLIAARQRLAKLKRAFAPDLIHIHGFGPSMFFHFETADAHPSRLLVTLITELPYREGHEVLGRTLRSADWVTAKSIAVLAQAQQFASRALSRLAGTCLRARSVNRCPGAIPIGRRFLTTLQSKRGVRNPQKLSLLLRVGRTSISIGSKLSAFSGGGCMASIFCSKLELNHST
jgi:hypothetical protein